MRLVMESHSYDHYLAETSQAISVDCDAAARAFVRLIEDESLRRKLGDAGRRIALERFAWGEVIRQYEQLWVEQEIVRQDCERLGRNDRAPALYPNPESAFACYPTKWIVDDGVLVVRPDAAEKLNKLVQIQTYHTDVFAKFVDRLAKSKEGTGTVLDHSTILFGSNMSNSDKHNNDPLPAAILGHANGKIKGGQHVKYPQDSRFSDLLVTLFDRNDIPVEKLGDSGGILSEI